MLVHLCGRHTICHPSSITDTYQHTHTHIYMHTHTRTCTHTEKAGTHIPKPITHPHTHTHILTHTHSHTLSRTQLEDLKQQVRILQAVGYGSLEEPPGPHQGTDTGGGGGSGGSGRPSSSGGAGSGGGGAGSLEGMLLAKNRCVCVWCVCLRVHLCV
jgi:hypothetical protein